MEAINNKHNKPKARSLIVWLLPLFLVVALILCYDRTANGPTIIGPFVVSSKSATRTSCDCFSEDLTSTTLRRNKQASNTRICCERILWRTHKFGTVLLGDLFAEFRGHNDEQQHDSSGTMSSSNHHDITKLSGTIIQTRPTPKSSNYSLPDASALDYRHVLVTRNWFDAIVSGYLYHKAGYECTVEFRGSNQHHSKHYDMERHYHNKFWDTQHLTWHEQYQIPYPPRQNRSLCAYLAQESEQDGIPILMDVALSRWYKGVVEYHEKAMAAAAAAGVDGVKRSLFLCYEDLVDPMQQEPIFYQILNFLFPSRNNISTTDNVHMPPPMKQALLRQQQKNQSQYEGGHASAHDPALRARLRALVEQYDQHLFRGVIASSNAIFGCGEMS